jgi:hypothetical protein
LLILRMERRVDRMKQTYIEHIFGNVTTNLSVQLLHTNKNAKSK